VTLTLSNKQTNIISAMLLFFNHCIYSFLFSGVFITKGDVGVGTIVGSAVFNILFVIGICGIFAGQVIQELLVLLFVVSNIK
jgi:Ca2+/Na+ antiporter